MSTYFGNNTFNNSIYVIEIEDNIEYDEDGIDSIPHVELQNNFSYLQKRKCSLIVGSGEPPNDLGLTLDSNSNTNTFYYNILSGSFYRVVYQDNQFKEWISFHSEGPLNITGIKIFESNINDFVELAYNDLTGEQNLNLSDSYGNLVNLKVNVLKYNNAFSLQQTQLHTKDSEMMLSSGIEVPTESDESAYKINRYTNTEVKTPKSITWKESLGAWSFGNSILALTELNAGNSKFMQDYTINSQARFDEIFNGDDFDAIRNYRFILIKQQDGNEPYILRNPIVFTSGNFKILMSPGVFIKPDSSWTGTTSIITMNAQTDGISNLDLQLRIDCNSLYFQNIFDISDIRNSKLDIEVKNCDCDNIILSNLNNDGLMIKMNMPNEEDPQFLNTINNVSNCFIDGNVFSGSNKLFNSCSKIASMCNIDGTPTISQGDFDF